jgi:hypothetical protein
LAKLKVAVCAFSSTAIFASIGAPDFADRVALAKLSSAAFRVMLLVGAVTSTSIVAWAAKRAFCASGTSAMS